MMKKKALEEELEDLEGKLLRAEKLLSGMHAQDDITSQAVTSYCWTPLFKFILHSAPLSIVVPT